MVLVAVAHGFHGDVLEDVKSAKGFLLPRQRSKQDWEGATHITALHPHEAVNIRLRGVLPIGEVSFDSNDLSGSLLQVLIQVVDDTASLNYHHLMHPITARARHIGRLRDVVAPLPVSATSRIVGSAQ